MKMAENTSWLKKSDIRPSMRAYQFNLGDINSTMTLQNGEGDTITKFAKRKSVRMFQDRKILSLIPQGKKKKSTTNLPTLTTTTTTGFRERTLKMVEGRTSLAPKLSVARRSQIAKRHPPHKIQSTPLHKSTPCEVPRSILRSARCQPKPLSAKRVIFDAATTEDGVFPLQESTIQDFTNFDLRKTVVSKIDASTNTEHIQEPTKETSNLNDLMLTLLKEVSRKLDLVLEKNACDCKTPQPRGNPLKSISQFMAHLDDIQEVSETITPNTQEVSENHSAKTTPQDDTPKIKAVNCEPVLVNRDTAPVQRQIENNVDTHSEGILGASNESAETTETLPINKENLPKRRSRRLHEPNYVDSPQPMTSKLRKFRKRGLPRYLDSFDLA